MQELDNLGVNWENANKHRQALKLGKPYPDSELCPCCFNPIQKQPFSLWENPKQMQIFGFGFPIMYSFMKNSIILLLVTLCSYNVLSLFLALQQNFSWCHGQPSQYHRSHCQSSFVLLARVSSRVTAEEQIVRAVSFVIHLLVLMYIRDKLVKLDSYFDERNCSMQDFSVLIKNISPQPNTTSKIKSYFNTITKHPVSIVDVILLPQYEHIEATRWEKRKLISKLRPLYKHEQEGQQKAHLQKQLKKINQKLSEQISSYKLASENDSALCHNAIVVVNTEEEKNECLEAFSDMYTLSKYKCFGREYVKMVMEEAPDPKSIIWENIALSPSTRKLRMIVSYAASVMILAGVTGLFYILMHVKARIFEKSVQVYQLEHDEWILTSGIILVYAMLLLVVLFNKIVMSKVFHYLTHYERHFRQADFQFSFGVKYCLGLFFTTALMTIAIEALHYHNYYTHLYGVVDEESVMFFFNAFFVPLFWFINPFQLYKQYNRPSGEPQHYTQRQANQLMEDYPYDIGKRYAEIIETLWFTYLYSTLIPIGAFISILGLGLYYWVDKYNLLRVNSVQSHLSARYIQLALKFLDLTLLFKALGMLLFDYQLRNQVHISTIVMCFAGLVYVLLPIDSILAFLHDQNFNLEEKEYRNASNRFMYTYRNLHPVYSA